MRIEEIFQETARLIAEVTHNVALVLAPHVSEAAFRCLQFLPLDDNRSIAVLLTDAGFVENRILNMPKGADFEDMRRLAAVINEHLAGLSLKGIGSDSLRKIHEALGDDELFETAAEIISRALDAGKKERLYLGGTGQLLGQPEFKNTEKIKDILLMLEEEEIIKDILRAHKGAGLTVAIGQENESDRIKDCSLVTAAYHLNGELIGTIAVLGPTRMEYGKAMSLLNYMNENLAHIFQKFYYG